MKCYCQGHKKEPLIRLDPRLRYGVVERYQHEDCLKCAEALPYDPERTRYCMVAIGGIEPYGITKDHYPHWTGTVQPKGPRDTFHKIWCPGYGTKAGSVVRLCRVRHIVWDEPPKEI